MVRARVALGSAVVLACLGALLTHREWADGPRSTLAFALLAGAGAAALLGWWAWREADTRWARVTATALALGVGLFPSAVHAVRLAQRAAAVTAELPEPIAFGRVVSPTVRRDATFSAEPGAVTLRAPAGSEGFLDVKRPSLGAHRWEVPRALLLPGAPASTERITWTAEVERDNTYFIVLDAEPLLVQVTPWDVFLQVRGTGGRIAETSIPAVVPGRSRNEWSFTYGDGAARLALDGRELWSGRLEEVPHHLRLGETRTDREHGGTLRLTALRYERRIAR